MNGSKESWHPSWNSNLMNLRKLNLFNREILQKNLHLLWTKESRKTHFGKLTQDNGWKKEFPLVAEWWQKRLKLKTSQELPHVLNGLVVEKKVTVHLFWMDCTTITFDNIKLINSL